MRYRTRKTPILLPENNLSLNSRAEWAGIFTKNGELENFNLVGGQKGLFIGASGVDGVGRRLNCDNVSFYISSCRFSGCNESCLEIGHNTNLRISRCIFRGGYKFSEYPNRDFLIRVHNSTIVFESCNFLNSEKMIFIGPNSNVSFSNCNFAVGKVGVVVSGSSYPRINNYYNGNGKSIVRFKNTRVQKLQTFCRVEDGGAAEVEDAYKNISFLDGGVYIESWTVV
jgi:hypothetical protein